MLKCYRHGSFLVFCCWGEDSESLFFSHGRLHWRGFFLSCAGVPESKGKQHNDVRVNSPCVCSLKKLFIKKRWPPSVRQIIITKVGWRCPSCRKIEISIKLNASQGLVTFLDLTFLSETIPKLPTIFLAASQQFTSADLGSQKCVCEITSITV